MVVVIMPLINYSSSSSVVVVCIYNSNSIIWIDVDSSCFSYFLNIHVPVHLNLATTTRKPVTSNCSD